MSDNNGNANAEEEEELPAAPMGVGAWFNPTIIDSTYEDGRREGFHDGIWVCLNEIQAAWSLHSGVILLTGGYARSEKS